MNPDGNPIAKPSVRWRGLLWATVAVCSGFMTAKVFQRFEDTYRPPTDSAPHQVLVKYGNIIQEHEWIKEYDVYIAPAKGVRTSSYYVLLTIVPKTAVHRDPTYITQYSKSVNYDGDQAFELSGFAPRGDVKPVHINPKLLLEHPSVPTVLILDFINHPISVQDSSVFMLQSRIH